jgi:hypothetical protein
VRVSRTRSPFPAQVDHSWTVGSTSKYTYQEATNTGYFTKPASTPATYPYSCTAATYTYSCTAATYTYSCTAATYTYSCTAATLTWVYKGNVSDVESRVSNKP